MTRLIQAFRWFFSILFGHGLEALQSMENKGEVPPGESVERAENSSQSGPTVEEARLMGREEGACLALAMLQEESRLLDFFMEDIGAFEDAQVGAAVRQVHGSASRLLSEQWGVGPACGESEGSSIEVHEDQRREFQLVGEVPSTGALKGVLRHHGWRVDGTIRLPNRGGAESKVLSRAEVEVSG